jgi:hypothetical protein
MTVDGKAGAEQRDRLALPSGPTPHQRVRADRPDGSGARGSVCVVGAEDAQEFQLVDAAGAGWWGEDEETLVFGGSEQGLAVELDPAEAGMDDSHAAPASYGDFVKLPQRGELLAGRV